MEIISLKEKEKIFIQSFFAISMNFEILPETRKYKTISSIPKDSKEYGLFRGYIQIEQKIFSQNLTLELFYEEIQTIIEEHKERQDQLFEYFIKLLVCYILIRPKQAEFSCNLLSILFLIYKDKQTFIVHTIKDQIQLIGYTKYHKKLFLQDVLYSQGIVKKKQKNTKKDKKQFLLFIKKTVLNLS